MQFLLNMKFMFRLCNGCVSRHISQNACKQEVLLQQQISNALLDGCMQEGDTHPPMQQIWGGAAPSRCQAAMCHHSTQELA